MRGSVSSSSVSYAPQPEPAAPPSLGANLDALVSALVRVNGQLAEMRGRLFGEGESASNQPQAPGTPAVSVSIDRAHGLLSEAISQGDSILGRL